MNQTENRFLAIAGNILNHRWIPLWIGLLAIAITLPVLSSGFAMDDVVHRDKVLGPSGSTDLWEILLHYFTFITPEQGDSVLETRSPWWALRETRIAFLRPLSAFTHWVDFQLWPDSADGAHLHSMFWYALLCSAATVLYRRWASVAWVGSGRLCCIPRASP